MISVVLGICLHAIGAASSSSSIVPGKFIKNWSWDVYWLGFSTVSLFILPIFICYLTFPQATYIVEILSTTDSHTLLTTLGLGFVYGFGGYGFGLACKMLGFSLTYAISIGFSATIGTLIPPFVRGGEELDRLLNTEQGFYVFLALAIAIVGMFLVGKAGYGREKYEQKNNNLLDSVLLKGVCIALFAGFLSACYGFALHTGEPMAIRAEALGVDELMRVNIVFILANGGAFISNLLITIYLITKYKVFRQFVDGNTKELSRNYVLAVLGGAAWYFQFFFFGMAESYMGSFKVASWAIHMILLIIFAQLWGLYFKEWKTCPTHVKSNLYAGLSVLTGSVLVVAYGNFVTTT